MQEIQEPDMIRHRMRCFLPFPPSKVPDSVAKRRNILRLFDVYFSLDALVCTGSCSCSVRGRAAQLQRIHGFQAGWGWNNSSLDPTARVTYSPDHTYFAHMEHPLDGKFTGTGTWRAEGSQMICRDYQHGESRAEILKITRNELQIKGPDGVVSTYERLK